MSIKYTSAILLVFGLVVSGLGSTGNALAQGTPERITIQAEGFFPSALAYDPARDRFLVASALDGNIYAVGADGTLTPIITDDTLVSARSLYVDPATDTLIVVSSDQAGLAGGLGLEFGGRRFPTDGTPPANLGTPGAPPMIMTPDRTPQPGQVPEGRPTLNAEFNPTTKVLVYSLTTGEQLRAVDLTDVAPGGPHLGSAIALDTAGNIYVADMLGGVIYLVDPAGGTYYLENPAFSSGDAGSGLSAIVYDDASRSLLVMQARSGTLWRVALDAPANPTQVTLPADLPPLRNLMADGAGNLVAFTGDQNGALALVRLSSNDNWASATVTARQPVEQSGLAAVLRGSEVYLLTGGRFGPFAGDGTPTAPDPNATPGPFEIVRVASGL